MRPCLRCKKEPRLIKIFDIYYVQCQCPDRDPYEFCGRTAQTAIKIWDRENHSIVEDNADTIKKMFADGVPLTKIAYHIGTTKYEVTRYLIQQGLYTKKSRNIGGGHAR